MESEQRRFGIIVGVSTFDPNEHITAIPFATNDAIRLYEVLLANSGFSPDRLYLLVSAPPDGFESRIEAPTRPNILNRLKYVAETATENDLILVFIASHGVEISNAPYLLTSDSRMNVVKETAIDANEINSLLESSSAKCVVRLFDACRSPFAQGRSSIGLMTDRFAQAMFAPAKGWATLSSCSSGEYSYESGDFDQGVFSYYLCEGICGKAANDSGQVTLEGLVEYLKISLSNWSDRQSLKQTPHFRSDLSGILVLSSPRPSVEPSPSIAPEHPLAQLQSGIRGELAATAADARQLQFTGDVEFKDFAEAVNLAFSGLVGEFNDSSIGVAIRAVRENQLQYASHSAWNQFDAEMHRLKIRGEFLDHPIAFAVRFSSSEAVVPSSDLIIAVGRFSFFYWLWYMHVCDVPELQKRFQPTPPIRTGVMTFKASAARDVTKVDGAVREVLSRSGSAIVEWTQQLREFVDTRLQPLRNLKSIIE